jgi:hypothetical protein
MKRFHVHLHVDDLAAGAGLYSKLFSAGPIRLEAHHAKWMLDTRNHCPQLAGATRCRDGCVRTAAARFAAWDESSMSPARINTPRITRWAFSNVS